MRRVLTSKDRGASLMGYALVVGLISVVALSSVSSGGSAVDELMSSVAGTMDGVVAGQAPSPAASASASASASPTIYAVWDPALSGYSISGDGSLVYSNGNLTVKRTGDADGSDSWANGRTDRILDGDKGYFEITINSFPNYANETGIHRVEVGLDISGVGQRIINCERGYYWASSASGYSLDVNHYCGPGTTVGIAVDNAAGKVWFTRNGTSWNSGGNPLTGDLGATPNAFLFTPGNNVKAKFNMMANDNATPSNGPTITLNAGQNPFVHSPPSGFDARLTNAVP